MKKTIIALIFILSTSMYSQDSIKKVTQEKLWRTLTVSNLSGVTLTGYYLQTFSVSLDYGLKNDWSISSWSGINYNTAYKGGWLSTQLLLNKKVSKYTIGFGTMYNSGNVNSPLPTSYRSNDLSVVINASRRFNLTK